MKHLGKYQTEQFLPSRVGTVDIGIASKMKHHVTVLIELDVSDARLMIRKKKASDMKVSFNSWLIKCISIALEENKAIQGIRKGKRKIIIFEDIDITIMIEREIGGKKVPLPYVIRKTNEKTIAEIFDEIRAAQNQMIENEGDFVLGEKKNTLLMKTYSKMPNFLRRTILKTMLRNPFIIKKNMGTVMITSVGMMGKINGWIIPKSIHPISFAIGSIVKKPGIKDGNIEIRQILHMTATVDHDVIDGAPAARTLSRLAILVESGFGLSS